MTFHDLLLVSNETTNLACCTVNTLFVCLLSSLILSVSCLRTKKKKKKSPSPVFVPRDLTLIYLYAFLVVIAHVNQGADQLNTKLNI